MNRYKKIQLSIITIIAIIIVGISITYAYFTNYEEIPGSRLEISSVTFKLNGNAIKNNETNILVSESNLTKNDGVELEFEYTVAGDFTFNFAVEYELFFHFDDDLNIEQNKLVNATEVYEFYDNKYVYKAMLNELIYYDNNGSYVDMGYLGVNESDKYKILLVYSPGSDDEFYESTYFNLIASVTSNVVATTTENFPYYYVRSYQEQTIFGVISAVATSTLTNNSIIQGRNIVLLDDLVLEEDLVFHQKVGLDINGNKLDFNGHTITIKDDNGLINNTYDDCIITDSNNIYNLVDSSNTPNTSIDSNAISIDLDHSAIKISNNNSLLNIINLQNFSVNNIAQLIQKKLYNQSLNTQVSSEGVYSVNIYDEYLYLQDYITINNLNELSFGYLNESFSIDSNGNLNVSSITSTDVINIYFTMDNILTDNVENSIVNIEMNIYGDDGNSIVNYLKSYIPSTINSSIFLPVYLQQFDAYITWIAVDEELLDENGMYLKNGYIDLDNWVSEQTRLGFIVEKDGNRFSDYTNDITVNILTEEERVKMILNDSTVAFDDSQFINYSFKLSDLIISKYNVFIPEEEIVGNTEEEMMIAKLNYIASYYFGITLISSLDLLLVENDFESKVLSKLDINDYNFDNNFDLVTDIEYYLTYNNVEMMMAQIDVPKTQISFNTSLSFTFNSSNIYSYDKIVVVLDSAEQTSLVDLNNTLRIPFDIYTDTQRNQVNGIYPLYNSNAFDLVDSFDNQNIIYTVEGDASQYVSVVDHKVIINKTLVPNTTTTVTLKALISNQEFYLSFDLIGIYHNELNDIEDSSLYVELLSKHDTNRDGILTVLEVNNIKSLSLVSKGIKSLKGIEFFDQLTSLDLSNNKIENIDAIENLSNLVSLNLSSNSIRSIEGLAYSSNLLSLNLSNNYITDISPIEHLIQINNLDLSNNLIYNFSYLNGFNNINTLKVFNNYISNEKSSVYEVGGETTYEVSIIRSNYYTFSLIKNFRNSALIYMRNASTNNLFDTNTLLATDVLSTIVPSYEAKNILSLPLIVGEYRFTYTIGEEDEDYLEFTSVNDEVTSVVINHSIVDNEITIYAYVKLPNEDSYQGEVFRAIDIRLLPNNLPANYEAMIETSSNVFESASSVIPDINLRSELFRTFNTNKSSIDEIRIIHQSELSQLKSLDLSYSNVYSLEGIQYFTGITNLNLTGNTIENEESNNEVSLSELASLVNLNTLTLSGQRYEYDSLANLANLTTLNIYGCYGLSEEVIQTMLYHVYLNNDVNIYTDQTLDSENNMIPWDPYTEQLTKLVRQLPAVAVFFDLGDYVDIPSTYSFYFYDDVLPTMFSTSLNDITGYNYYYTGSNQKKFDTYLIRNENRITYSVLNGFTNTAYIQIDLSSNLASNNKVINTSTSYYMALKMEYNYKYVYKENLESDEPGTPLNQLVAAKEAMMYIMENITTNSNLINANCYDINSDTYVFDQSRLDTYVNIGSVNELKLLGIFDPSLSSVTDGLQYLTKIKKLVIRRDFSFGDGASLANIESLTFSYSGVDLSELEYVVPNLKTLNISNGYYFILDEHNLTSNGPNSLIDSYFKYLPNLETLSITTSSDATIYNFSSLLAYCYMPVGTVPVGDISVDTSVLYEYNESTNTMFISNEGEFVKMPNNRLKTITLSEISGGLGYDSLDNILTLVASNYNSNNNVYTVNGINYTPSSAAGENNEYTYNINEEFNEFAGNISDYGLKVNDNYYRELSGDVIFNDHPTLTLPVRTEDFLLSNETNETLNRSFIIKWYLIDQACIEGGNRLEINSSTYTYIPRDNSESYYYIIEGVISNGSSSYSIIYPITVLSDDNIGVSIAKIKDKNLRLLAFINDFANNTRILNIDKSTMYDNINNLFNSSISLRRYLSPIMTLDGIEQYAITNLSIKNQYISNISSLWSNNSNCKTSLTSIDFTNNILSDASGLSNLSVLSSVNLYGNNIISITLPLSLSELNLTNNTSFSKDEFEDMLVSTYNNLNMTTYTNLTSFTSSSNKIDELDITINNSGLLEGINAFSEECLDIMKYISYITTSYNIYLDDNVDHKLTGSIMDYLLGINDIVSSNGTQNSTELVNHILVNGMSGSNSNGAVNFGNVSINSSSHDLVLNSYGKINTDIVKTSIRLKATIDTAYSVWFDKTIQTLSTTGNDSGIRVYTSNVNSIVYPLSDFDPQFINYLFNATIKTEEGIDTGVRVYDTVDTGTKILHFNSINNFNRNLIINENYNIKSLKGMEKLNCNIISISNNPICDIGFTNNFNTLTNLNINSNVFINNISGLSYITNLNNVNVTISDCNRTIISSSFKSLSLNNYNTLNYQNNLTSEIEDYICLGTDASSSNSWFRITFDSNKPSLCNHTYKSAIGQAINLMSGNNEYNDTNYSFALLNNEIISILLTDTKTISGNRNNLTEIAEKNITIASNNYNVIMIKETYYLGKKISYTYLKNTESNNYSISNNIITFNTDTVAGTYQITVEVRYNGNMVSNVCNFIISNSNLAGETKIDVSDYYVELSNGSIVNAGTVFESSRLIYEIFDLSQTNFEGTNESVYGSDELSYIPLSIIDGKIVMTHEEVLKVTRFKINNVGINSLKGIEIFINLKEFEINKYGNNKIGLSGIDLNPLQNMQLTSFTMNYSLNAAIISDYSFLYNSRETLTSISLGSKGDYIGESSPQNFDDISWLMSFSNLKTVSLYGLSGYEKTTSFQYFITWMYINKLNSNNENLEVLYNDVYIDVPSDVKKATTILTRLSMLDNINFDYINNFELFPNTVTSIEDGIYYLPTYLELDSLVYKLAWNSLSSYVDIDLYKMVDENTDSNLEIINIGVSNYAISDINTYNNEFKEAYFDGIDLKSILDKYMFVISISNSDDNMSNKAILSLTLEMDSSFSTINDGVNVIERYNPFYYERALTINFGKNNVYPQILFRDGCSIVELPTDFTISTYDSNIFSYNSSTKELRLININGDMPSSITDTNGNTYKVYWDNSINNMNRLNDLMNITLAFTGDNDYTMFNNLSTDIASLYEGLTYYDINYLSLNIYNEYTSYISSLDLVNEAFKTYTSNWAKNSAYTMLETALDNYLNNISNTMTKNAFLAYIEDNYLFEEYMINNRIYAFDMKTAGTAFEKLCNEHNDMIISSIMDDNIIAYYNQDYYYIVINPNTIINNNNGNTLNTSTSYAIRYQYIYNSENFEEPINSLLFSSRSVANGLIYQYINSSNNLVNVLNTDNALDIMQVAQITSTGVIKIIINDEVANSISGSKLFIEDTEGNIIYENTLLTLENWILYEQNKNWYTNWSSNYKITGSVTNNVQLANEVNFLRESARGYFNDETLSDSDIYLAPYVTLAAGYKIYIIDRGSIITNSIKYINSNFVGEFSANLYFDLTGVKTFRTYYAKNNTVAKIYYYSNKSGSTYSNFTAVNTNYMQIQFFSINSNKNVFSAGTWNRVSYISNLLFDDVSRYYYKSVSVNAGDVNICMSDYLNIYYNGSSYVNNSDTVNKVVFGEESTNIYGGVNGTSEQLNNNTILFDPCGTLNDKFGYTNDYIEVHSRP